MRVSLVILSAVFIVMVNSATTKAPKPKSAYTYLRTVRGTKSCASGSCPLWERHGRSFAALRCYSQEYKECTCLHRMCFNSCLFSRKICNEEMVSCLKQICPRCMPASASSMCGVYDSMAQSVANALEVFTCYSCCPNVANSPRNNTNGQNSMAITKPQSGNGGNSMTQAASGSGPGNVINGVTQNGGARPSNGLNQMSNGNRNNTNGNNNNFGGVLPGSGNNNIKNNGNNNNNRPNQNQQIRQAVRTTARRVVTTRRVQSTTRRAATVRTPVKAQKKPQTNNN